MVQLMNNIFFQPWNLHPVNFSGVPQRFESISKSMPTVWKICQFFEKIPILWSQLFNKYASLWKNADFFYFSFLKVNKRISSSIKVFHDSPLTDWNGSLKWIKWTLFMSTRITALRRQKSSGGFAIGLELCYVSIGILLAFLALQILFIDEDVDAFLWTKSTQIHTYSLWKKTMKSDRIRWNTNALDFFINTYGWTVIPW